MHGTCRYSSETDLAVTAAAGVLALVRRLATRSLQHKPPSQYVYTCVRPYNMDRLYM